MTIRRILILLSMVAVLVAACGGDDSGDTTSGGILDQRVIAGGEGDVTETTAAAVTTTIMPSATDARGEDAPAREASTNSQTALQTATDLGRRIIFTANLAIEVEDVVEAGAEIENAMAGLGGILFGQETTTGERPRSILTIKIDPDRFRDALDRLAGVGEILSQSVFADDVTERVVDLESRIATAQASVERLRALLEQAGGIEDVVELESELLERETDLEVLRGQLRTLEDAVALATIVIVLTEPEPQVPQPALEVEQTAYTGHDDGDRCPGSEELTIDEGEPMTVCFVLTNTGDTDLVEIEVRDIGLDMDEGDAFVVEGDPDVALEPDERLVLAFETQADPALITSIDVRATPVDADGKPLRLALELEGAEAVLEVIPDDSLPGFTDALGAAWEAFLKVVGVLVLVAGAAVPFLWVPLLLAALWRWRRSRVAVAQGEGSD